MKRLRAKRSERGAIAAVLLLVIIMIVVVGAAFSFDYGKGVVVKEELQKATDAGALAGALELARERVTGKDLKRAKRYALLVTGSNTADSQPVSRSKSTIVNVSMSSKTMPRTVTVTVTKTTGNLFASLIGWNSMPISSRSTASVSQRLRQIKPYQLYPLAVSLDHRPKTGPQRRKALQDLAGRNQRFTLVLNPQKSKNASWIKNWRGKCNPLITIGQNRLMLNGVQANLVRQLKRRDVIAIPVITGGPPFNKTRRIVGVVGFEVIRVKFPLQINGRIKDPLILKGTPGQPMTVGLGQKGQRFLDEYSPWMISLTN